MSSPEATIQIIEEQNDINLILSDNEIVNGPMHNFDESVLNYIQPEVDLREETDKNSRNFYIILNSKFY